MVAAGVDRPSTRTFSRSLIEAAGRAPSPDNNQPWAFRAENESIDVFHCRSRAVPSDVEDLFAGIALGAAIENIVLEASRHDHQAIVEYSSAPFGSDDDFEPVATIRWTSPGWPDPLADSIVARTSNRRPYQMTPVTLSERRELSNAIQDSRCEVEWLTTKDELRHLARLVTTADRIRFEYQRFHDELHKMLRFGEREANATGDGLETSTLEIPRIAWPVLRWLRPWNRMRFFNRVGLSRLFAHTSSVQIQRSGAVGLLTVDTPDSIGYLEAGRALQRIWLTATGLGLAFQPVGALPLFLRRLNVLGESAFEPRHARILGCARDDFANFFLKRMTACRRFSFAWGIAPLHRVVRVATRSKRLT